MRAVCARSMQQTGVLPRLGTIIPPGAEVDEGKRRRGQRAAELLSSGPESGPL